MLQDLVAEGGFAPGRVRRPICPHFPTTRPDERARGGASRGTNRGTVDFRTVDLSTSPLVPVIHHDVKYRTLGTLDYYASGGPALQQVCEAAAVSRTVSAVGGAIPIAPRAVRGITFMYSTAVATRNRHRDPRGAGLLLRRGLPPALPGRESPRLLPGPFDGCELPGLARSARSLAVLCCAGFASNAGAA